MITQLIVDTDAGTDDAIALLMALRAPGCTVAAITAVNGNVALGHVLRNVGVVLDAAGADNIPFFRGADRPLVTSAVDASHVHGADGLGDAGFAPSVRRPERERAAQAIVRLARAQPGALTLVALGPLTNIALALALEPRLPTLLKNTVLMGGATQARGNTTAAAEFNIYADPEAAAACFAGGLHPTMLTWEATLATTLTWMEWDRVLAAGHVGQTFVRAIYANYVRRTRDDEKRPTIALADPLAMAVALAPSCALLQPAFVAVETGGSHARGQTVADLRPRDAPPPNAQIVTAVDRAAFLALLERACA